MSQPTPNLPAFALIALCVLFIVVEPALAQDLSPAPPEPPAAEQGTGSTENSSNQENPPESWQQWIVRDRNAPFTIAVTIFTFFLAVSTCGLWIVTIRSGRHQLRAYIALRSSKVKFRDHQIILTLNFMNAGQTPAYDLYTFAATGIFPKDGKLPPVEAPTETPDKMVLGPGNWHPYVKIITPKPREMDAIYTRELWGFIWGCTKYRDAFGEPRFHKFIYRIGRDDRGNWALQPTKGGEKAN